MTISTPPPLPQQQRRFFWPLSLIHRPFWSKIRHPRQLKAEPEKPKRLQSVFNHVVSNYANLSEQKKAREKSSTPIELVSTPNMATVSLFWDTNMAVVTLSKDTV